jgi:hypothetical protein
MHKFRKSLNVVGIFVAIFALSLSHLTGITHASGEWDWQRINPDSWAEYEGWTGTMINGDIYTTAVSGGYMWAGGTTDDNEGVLYRYDPLTNELTNQTPGDMNEVNNYAIHTLLDTEGGLMFTTDNGSGSQVWYQNGATWDRDFDYDEIVASAGITQTYSIARDNTRLCVVGLGTSDLLTVICRPTNGGAWVDLDVVGETNAQDPNWDLTSIVLSNNNVFVNGITDGGYHGIWKYDGASWTQLETEFTNEEEIAEDGAGSQIVAMGNDPIGRLVIVERDDNGVMTVHRYDDSIEDWDTLGGSNFDDLRDSTYYRATIAVHDGSLFVSAGAGGVSIGIFEWNSDEWVVRNQEYFNIDPMAGGQPNYATSMVSDGARLYVATASEGEGAYNPQLWRSPPFVGGDDEEEPAPDADSDNISDTTEDAAPNSGDANDDGFADSEQANVTTFVNNQTNKYMSLKTPCDNNYNVQSGGESSGSPDSGYAYPAGLMAFVIRGCDVGDTVSVEVYYYGTYNPSDYVARKRIGGVYTTIPGAVFTNVTVGGQSALKLTYSIKDGGPLDDDGIEDGNIVDPVGPGLQNVGTPNTGVQPVLDFLSKR